MSETPIVDIAEAAARARRDFDIDRRYLGTTADGTPLWSWLGTIIAAPAERRLPR